MLADANAPSVADLRGSLAVWAFCDRLATSEAIDFARTVESLGYRALWIPEAFGRDPMVHSAALLGATTTLALGTGIATITGRLPGTMKQGAFTLADQAPGRFTLGLGVSHERTVEEAQHLDYSRPLTRMRDYLDAYDAAAYRGPRTAQPPLVLAALGPKMLALAAARANGAITYSVPPEHTRRARELLGPEPALVVEQKIVVTDDPVTGLRVARQALAIINTLPNYRRAWTSLGIDDASIDGLDEPFVRRIVAIGDAAAVRRRVEEHLLAGASEVCVQPLAPDSQGRPDVDALEALAGSTTT